MKGRWILAGAVAAALAATLPGSALSDAAPAVVLRHGRVWVGDGRVLDDASIVIRDGRIEAVGPKIALPSDAETIDLRGLTVSPGLLDTWSERGLDEPPAQSAAGPPQNASFAHLRAADLLSPDDAVFAPWREAGVLTLNVAPSRGIWRGQSAVVNLSGGPRERMVVRSPAAMATFVRGLGYRNRQLGQGEPGGEFPTRLIGVFAYLRQSVLDARYRDAASGTAPAPGAVEVDPMLEALAPVARRTMPVLLPALEEREVRRMLALAEELEIDPILAGGGEAALLADTLRARDVPVLVSLHFPEADADVAPEFYVPLRVQRFRALAPRRAAELARAGVRIAFYSDGLASGAEFLRALRRTVAEGLPRDTALRAATLGAARILRVDDRLGSLERGKLANLVVSDGHLLDVASRIRMVFVEGRRFDVTASTPPPPAPPLRLPAAFPPRPPAMPAEFVLTNVNVMTVTHGTIQGGSVLVRGGRIAAVGHDVRVAPGVRRIDGQGRWVTPGFVDAHDHIATDSHNEATSVIGSHVGVGDTLNPNDIHLYRELAGGVTTAHAMHGSVNPIGGKTVVIKMRWGRTAPELLFAGAPPGLKLAIGQASKRTPETPITLMAYDALWRDAFTRAREYARGWDEYRARRAAGGAAGPAPRRDLKLEPLAEVLAGKRFVHVHCQTPDEILTVIAAAEAVGFKVRLFHHGRDAFKVAPEIARHGGAGVTLFFDAGDNNPYSAAVFKQEGVLASINSDAVMMARFFNQFAGRAMQYGDLTEDEALALVTLNPARQLGIDERVGSIDVGKDADLVLFNRYPLSAYAVADMVFIDGQLYYSREHEQAREAWVAAEARAAGTPLPSLPASPGPAAPVAAPVAAPASPDAPDAPDAPRRRGDGRTHAIVNARIVTVSGPVIDRGTVLVRDGLIADVGPSVAVPAGAETIDAAGLTVYPGLFDASSSVGLEEARAALPGEMAPQLVALTSFVGDSEMIERVRARGITTINARYGRGGPGGRLPTGGLIPGQASLMDLDGWTREDMVVKRASAMVLAFPSLGELEYSEDERYAVPSYSETRKRFDRDLAELKGLFARARAYGAARKVPGAPTSAPDLQLEALQPVLDRRQLVLIEADSHVDIANAVRFAQEERLDFVLVGAEEAARMADFLAANHVRVILGSTQGLPPGEDDPVDIAGRTPAVLRAKGVTFALSGRGTIGFDTRHLAYQAGNAVARGLPADAALRSITLSPAEILGVADQLGSIDKGKRANLAIADGDILDSRTRIKHVFIDGRPVSVETPESRLYEIYRNRPPKESQ